MKAVCIKNIDTNGCNLYLKIGKVYELDIYRWGDYNIDDQCRVFDDGGKSHYVPIEWFCSIEDYRQEQLNKVLE